MLEINGLSQFARSGVACGDINGFGLDSPGSRLMVLLERSVLSCLCCGGFGLPGRLDSLLDENRRSR